MRANKVCECGQKLSKDVVALNKKMLGRQVKKRFCLSCLADMLNTSEDELKEKIDEFRNYGCSLFV